MPSESLSSSRYFVTFKYDFSRKTWTYFLKNKSGTFEKFKVFKILVEAQTGLKIQSMRSDRGGEYQSSEFLKYYELHSIDRQLT